MPAHQPRSWPTIIAHADMDAFYAAVEQLDQPELRGKPVLIGPQSYRGVVLTASYEARRFGVRSAMPVAKARQLCPDAIMVSPRFSRYQDISRQVMDIFADFSPSVEALSLDEAFLDMSGAEHLFGAPREMGLQIKQAVKEATRLDISVGVASTKYVAKAASAHDKPDGLTVVPPSEVKSWLDPLDIRRLWGIGAKTAPRFHALGITTIGQIARSEPNYLVKHLGPHALRFFELANGRDPRRVARGRTARSIGSDRTLASDINSRPEIRMHLRRSAERIARRLRNKNYVARGVRIRLKTHRFEMLSRQSTTIEPLDTAEAMMALADQLLANLNHTGPFRLVGMAAFNLDWQDTAAQLDMFSQPEIRKLESTMDLLHDKYGKDVVIKARDLSKRATDRQGGISSNGVNLDYLDYRDGERVSRPDQ